MGGTIGLSVIDESNNGNEMLLSGGQVYGDKKLDTLHYGSSGGKGVVQSGKAQYYSGSDRGGGIIELIAQRIVNEGSIRANKNNVKNGKNVIDEDYVPLHGNGGNGRIAIYYDEALDEETKKSLNDKIMISPKPYCAKTRKCKKSKLPDWKGPY